MSKKLVARFVDDFIKATNILYSVYSRLLNFEFEYFNIGLVDFINFSSFYRTESLIITVTTILEAEVVKNILNNKNIVYTTGSGRRKRGKKRSINLFVVTIVIRLDNIYLAKFLIILLLIFAFRFVVTTFFSVVAIFAFFTTIFFVRTVLRKIYIAPFESLRL